MRDEPTVYTGTVRDYLREGGGTASSAELLDLSPVRLDAAPPHAVTAAWFRALWNPADLLFVTTKGPALGRVGANIRTADAWARVAESGGALGGDIVGVNPLSYEGGERLFLERSGVRAEDLAAVRPFLVLELDELPLAEQLAFWLGLLRRSPLASRLVSLVTSGGRSVHGLLAMRAPDALTWEAQAGTVRRLFATDPEARTVTEETPDGAKEKTVYPFRADAAAMHPLTKTRIAGAARVGSGARQVLVYFNPAAVCEP